MSSLVLSDVAYAFPDDTTLFAGLNLAIGPGLTSLVGRNGAGKSTLFRLIAGELTFAEGSISVDGRPATARGPDGARLRQRHRWTGGRRIRPAIAGRRTC